MEKFTEKEIKEGLNKAYKEAGHNAYFGEGFKAGIEFANQGQNLPISNVSIETAVNVNGDMTAGQIKACRKKLIVLRECGKDKEALIGQLEMMILGLKTNFDWFAS